GYRKEHHVSDQDAQFSDGERSSTTSVVLQNRRALTYVHYEETNFSTYGSSRHGSCGRSALPGVDGSGVHPFEKYGGGAGGPSGLYRDRSRLCGQHEIRHAE